MGSSFAFRTGAACHVGKVRALNEDRWLARPAIGLWVVADGMGGLGGGDVASAAVVGALGELEPPSSGREFLREFESRIARVNGDLRALAAERSQSVIGTTLAAVLIFGPHFACIWCGDSRVYRLRAGNFAQLSRDHSEVQELIDRGVLDKAEARAWPRRNVLTRALGANDVAALEIVDGAAFAGDRYLLCTDGLTTHVEDVEIAGWLRTGDPQSASENLVAMALGRGGKDNVTVVIVVCDPR
jgi:serine/threonine protein phosphatase PrpC